jgi:hypothetical protein
MILRLAYQRAVVEAPIVKTGREQTAQSRFRKQL